MGQVSLKLSPEIINCQLTMPRTWPNLIVQKIQKDLFHIFLAHCHVCVGFSRRAKLLGDEAQELYHPSLFRRNLNGSLALEHASASLPLSISLEVKGRVIKTL